MFKLLAVHTLYSAFWREACNDGNRLSICPPCLLLTAVRQVRTLRRDPLFLYWYT